MKIKLILLFTLSCFAQGLFAQSKLPVIRATSPSVSIRDGARFSKDSWTLTPSARPDVYEADRTRRTKRVCFITDQDSIAFTLKPGRSRDFIILLNGTDSCFTHVRSAITHPVAKVTEPWHADTIAFTLSPHNNILVQAILNDRDTLLLMFHSALQGLDVMRSSLDRAKSIRVDGTDHLNSWGGSAEAGHSAWNSMRIGELRWDSLDISIDEQSGRGSDGKFGYDFFADRVIEINYDRSELIIHNRLPKGMKGYAPWPIEYRKNSFFVEGNVSLGARSYSEHFMFHTGYSGQFILGTGFMERNGLYGKLDTASVEELKDSLGNIIKNVTIEASSFSIGKSRVRNIRGSTMDRTAKFPDSVLGNGFLKRFNVLIDLRNDVIHVKPNGLAGSTTG